MSRQASLRQVTCPACLGSKREERNSQNTGLCVSIERCRECHGKGKVSERQAETGAAGRRRTGLLIHAANTVLEAAGAGNMDRARHYANLMVGEMFTIGSANARRVLDFIAAGEWADHGTGDRGRCTREVADEVRRMVIEMGRERAA